VKISSLLELNRKFSTAPGALATCFGDGFLLVHNSVYRGLRERALGAGFGFSTKQNDAYRALPLSQLDTILKTKIIPYIDNVSVLDELEAQIPKMTVWADISDNFKGNSVFHESCHAVARGFVDQLAVKIQQETNGDLVSTRVLAILLEESFANTCELLSIIDAGDAAHRIFIELNSYAYMIDDRVHLSNAAKDIGLGPLTKFILLMYVHSNFLRELTDRDFDRSLVLAMGTGGPSIDPKIKKSLRQLAKVAFKLNPRFREVTTRFYLRLSGIQIEVAALSGFDFLQAIEASTSARLFIEKATLC
jgi:hypothetical protein